MKFYVILWIVYRLNVSTHIHSLSANQFVTPWSSLYWSWDEL